MKVCTVLPIKLQAIEGWMFPRVLLLVPTEIKDEVIQERVHGNEARVVKILFKLLKQMKPGSMEEQGTCFKFQTGECTFGNKCRYEHTINAKARIAATTIAEPEEVFPLGAAGLDSWANVWLKHVVDPTTNWTESLTLADGSSSTCNTAVGPKGIPQALVQKTDTGSNIDLLPMNWMIERWCDIAWGKNVIFITPKGNVMHLDCWSGMPYLTAAQIKKALEDLPEANEPGRSGKATGTRVCSTCHSTCLRSQGTFRFMGTTC